MIPLVTVQELWSEGLTAISLAILAGLIALGAAAGYRWYVHEELPQGIALLLGASAIALILNTTASLGQSIGGTTDLLDQRAAVFTIAALLAGAFASEGGRRIGDTVGERLAPGWTFGGIDREVSAFVKGGGRIVRVRLPDEIRDIDGYEPVRTDLKEHLAGEVMTVPGRLTHAELHDAFVNRLQADLGIGKVDVEFTDTGEVAYLAVGRGEAGVGHTLQSGQVAMAVRADPAFSASMGDRVQVWRIDPQPCRVVTAEVRGLAGEVVTLAVDADQVDRLEAEDGYRLVTMPGSRRPDREFAAILRRANESLVEVAIADGSDLVGRPAGAEDVLPLVVDAADGERLTPPAADRPYAAGDAVIAMGRPDALRRFEAAAQGTST